MMRTPEPGTAPRPRRARVRERENAQPPVWLGLLFLAVGVAAIAVFLSFSLLAAGVGLLFAVIGLALTLTSVTADRERRPQQLARASGQVAVFTRSPMRILVDFVLAPLGAIGFFAFAVFMLSQGPFGWIGSALFVFFGFVMLGGAAVTIRRGVRRTLAEVGPEGLWTPELPRRLAWSEIARVEAEASVGAAGEAGLAVYHRLGIWPRDASLADAAPGQRAAALVRGYTRLVNTAGGASMSDPARMAPFGISAFEIEQDFDELLRAVGRYLPVGGILEPGDGTGGVDGPVPRPHLVPAAPPIDGLPGAILAEIGDMAVRTGQVPPIGMPPEAAELAEAQAREEERRTDAPSREARDDLR